MIKAKIFDFNGVVVDDEPIHFAMFRKVLAGEGIALSQMDYYRYYLGMNDRDCFAAVLKKDGRNPAAKLVNVLIRRKARFYRAYIARHLIFFPGVRGFLRRAARKYPLAIASGALRSEIDYILRKGKLEACFSAIVAAEDVRNGKPHPEGFQKALRLLNRNLSLRLWPNECLVVEDSLEGIRAAKKAGMRCLALASSHPPSQLKRADWVVKSYQEIRGHVPIALQSLHVPVFHYSPTMRKNSPASEKFSKR